MKGDGYLQIFLYYFVTTSTKYTNNELVHIDFLSQKLILIVLDLI